MSMSMKSKFELFGEETRTNEPTRDEYKQYRQKEYNDKMKKTMRFVGENMSTCIIVLATTLLVGSVFGNIGINVFSVYTVMDFFLTLVAYILIEYTAGGDGAKCGKIYPEYINLHTIYLNMREEIYKRGIALMYAFCDWQVDVEYEFYIRRMCKELKIDYKEYVERYSKMSLEELADMFTHKGEEKPKFKLRHPIRSIIAIYEFAKVSDLAKDIFYLRTIKPIVLTPEILLTDGRPRRQRGGVGISGEEELADRTTGFGHIVAAIIAVVATVAPFFMAKEWDPSLIYIALAKLVGVFYRYYRGYSKGAKAFNTTEVKHLGDKIQYLHLYIEYLNKKIYLELADKYDIVNIIGNQTYVEDKWQEQINEAGAGAPAGQN